MTKKMVKESTNIILVSDTTVNGKTVSETVQGNIFTFMGTNMKGIG